MKKIMLVLSLGGFCSVGFAGNPDVDACLKAWGKHPFGENPTFRTLQAKVKVMGVGGSTDDRAQSEKPELILVKAQTSVMSGLDLALLNENGWYCIKSPVAVMGRIKINAGCKSHLANASDGVAVAGSTESEGGGVAVLGKIKVERACKK